MKSRYKKLSLMLVVILLMASFFVIDVSAADDDSSDSSSEVYYVGTYPYAGYFDVAIADSFDMLDKFEWSDLTENNKLWVTPMEGNDGNGRGTLDYQYNMSLSSPDYSVLSYCFDEYPIYPSADSTSVNVRLSGGTFDFFTDSNIFIRGVRFSLRSYLGEVSYVVAASDIFDVYETGSGSLINDYSIQVDGVTFSWMFDKMPIVVLCVDFLFYPQVALGPIDHFMFSIYDDANFYLLRYPTQFGPQPAPYYPELDSPYFNMPEKGDINDLLSIQGSVLGSSQDASSSLSDLNGDLRSGISSFSNGLSNIAVLMDYLIDDIPFLNFIITFSLLLGLISFMLGLGSSLVSAKSQSSDARQAADRLDRHRTSDSSSTGLTVYSGRNER